jgi:hypothetical protein
MTLGLYLFVILPIGLLIVTILGYLVKKELDHEERVALQARAASHPTTVGGGLPSWRLYNDDPTYR